MPKRKKSTKKFVKNHLKKEISLRQEKQKSKRRYEKRVRNQEERQERRKQQKTENARVVAAVKQQLTEQKKDDTGLGNVEDLDIDAFMNADMLDVGDGDNSDTSSSGAEEALEAMLARKRKRREEEEDSDSDDDDDEDEPAGDDDEDALERDILKHQQELADLAKSDPSFHKHLRKEASALLEFEQDDDAVEEDDDDNEEEEESKGKPKEASEPEVMDTQKWKALCSLVVGEHSLRALKRVLKLYRTAVRVLTPNATIDKDKNSSKRLKADKAELHDQHLDEREVSVTQQRFHTRVVNFCVKHTPALLLHHITQAKESTQASSGAPKGKQTKRVKGKAKAAGAGGQSKDAAKAVDPKPLTYKTIPKQPRWKGVRGLAKGFLGNTVRYMQTQTDPNTVRYFSQQLMQCMAFFGVFPKLAGKLLKVLLQQWAGGAVGGMGSGGDSEDPEENKRKAQKMDARISAFLAILKLAKDLRDVKIASEPGQPSTTLLELCLKGTYLTYVRNSKFTSASTLPNIVFMSNCVTEVYGVDDSASYQHAFVYLRQLAVHLRNANLNKTKDSNKGVYNWQFLNCLRAWASVLSAHARASKPLSVQAASQMTQQRQLRALVYPFVQICVGVIQLQPSSRYFPLRFLVCRLLHQVSTASCVYVPLSAYLLDVLHCSELKKKPKPSTAKVPQFKLCVKLSKDMLSTQQCQQELVATALSLLQDHLASLSYSISFPEVVFPIEVHLRKFAKETKIHKARKLVKTLLQRIELNKKYVLEHRAKVTYGPKEMQTKGLNALLTFKPLSSKASDMSPLDRFASLQRKQEEETGLGNLQLLMNSQSGANGRKPAAPKAEDEKEEQQVEEEKEEEDDSDVEMDESRSGPVDDDDDDDDDEDDLDDDEEEPADVVTEFVLSDSDDSGDEETTKKQQQQKKKKRNKKRKPKNKSTGSTPAVEALNGNNSTSPTKTGKKKRQKKQKKNGPKQGNQAHVAMPPAAQPVASGKTQKQRKNKKKKKKKKKAAQE